MDSIVLQVRVLKSKWHAMCWRGWMLYLFGCIATATGGSQQAQHWTWVLWYLAGCCFLMAAIEGNAPVDVTVEPKGPNSGDPSAVGPAQLLESLQSNAKQLKGDPN